MKLLVALFFISIYLATVESGDANLFVTLWDEINAFTTPNFPETAYSSPPEMFIMNMPGQVIDPSAYDETTWKSNRYANTDPDYNMFQLTDSIPLSYPYYVDSGRKVSAFYLRFLQNYVTGVQQTPNEQEKITEFKEALKKIMNEDFSPSPLASAINRTRASVRDTLNVQLELRSNCLYNEAVGICQRKAVYWADSVSDQNMLYLVTQYEMLTAQAQVYALTSRSLDSIIFGQYERYMSSVRASVGAKSFLGEYMQVRYDPPDWYTWWYKNTTTTSADSSFVRAGVVSQTGKTASSKSFTRNSWGVSGTVMAYGVSVSGGVSRSLTKERMDSSSKGQTVSVAFELAMVKVIRPWFDPTIFDYSPLGVAGIPLEYYSDGNYKGQFPWYVGKMVVARNIKVFMGEWSSEMQSTLQQASTDVSLKVGYGPFVVGGSGSFSNSDQQASTSFRFSNNELYVKGPQIIGYVMNRVPRFPNYAEEK